MSSSETAVATQSLLSAEYAAAYGYGVVGAHLSGAARLQALRALAWHQSQQPDLVAALTASGVTPSLAEPAYVLPFAVTDAATARRLAARIEDDVAIAYADLIAQAQGTDRHSAALALGVCAVRATQWRGASIPFPGLPQQATGLAAG